MTDQERLAKIQKAENILKTIMFVIGALALGLGIAIIVCMVNGINADILIAIGFALIMSYIPIKPMWFMIAEAKSNILDKKERK